MTRTDKHNYDDTFNFVGEFNHNNFQYVLKISVNAQEIIHQAKFYTTDPSPSIKSRKEEFLLFAEGKSLNIAKTFFHSHVLSSTLNDETPDTLLEAVAIDPILYCWQLGMWDYTSELPLLKSKINRGEILCSCYGLTSAQLRKMKSDQIFTMEHLVKETKAGTGCGACRADLKIIMQSCVNFGGLSLT